MRRDVADRHGSQREQVALRRVATLVAEGVPQQELFAVVAEEIAHVVEVPLVRLMRYEPDGSSTECACFSTAGTGFPLGEGSSLASTTLLGLVRETVEAARLDATSGPGTERPAIVLGDGISSVVGTPIVVARRPWGAVVAFSSEQLPEDTEERLTDFTELVATAIATAESHATLAQLVEQQAALRRIATLVAEGVRPPDLYAVMAKEVASVCEVPATGIVRYESDGAATQLASFYVGLPEGLLPVGTRMDIAGRNILRLVRETGRAARIDDYSTAHGPLADFVRGTGITSTVGVPIVVGGRVWGAMVGSTTEAEPLPESTAARISEFTELLATAIQSSESREALERLVVEQAALRRMATLVARGTPPAILFAAVVEEVGRLLPVATAAMGRCDVDGMVTTLAAWSSTEVALTTGRRWRPEGNNITALVVRTGRSARLDDFSDASGAMGYHERNAGYRWAVGSPITVEGRLWGVMSAASKSEQPMPADMEDRLASFTELVATSIANADSRAALARVADEQAALRRVATLVAEGVQPAVIFNAVSHEVARLFTTDAAGVAKYDQDDQAVVFVGAAPGVAERLPVGTRWDVADAMAVAQVCRTGRSARMSRGRRLISTVASPILVGGRLWGALYVSAEKELPPDAEERLENFSDLVATAIANADSTSELAASRRRIVAAADDARRRIERDLHDGTQQRLISLGLDLRAAEDSVPSDQDDLRAELARVESGLADAVEELREISRGIHPATLAKGGLGAALRTLVRRSRVPVVLDAHIDRRLPGRVEVAAYYVVSEALTNVTKHARATAVHVGLTEQDGALRLVIRDDGIGGADQGRGSGLVGLHDRVEALGGTLTIESSPGRGTSLLAILPLDDDESAP